MTSMQTENPFRYRDVQAPKWIQVNVKFVVERFGRANDKGGKGCGTICVQMCVYNIISLVGVKMTKEGPYFVL